MDGRSFKRLSAIFRTESTHLHSILEVVPTHTCDNSIGPQITPSDHFNRLYDLSEKYKWKKRCFCFNDTREKVGGYDPNQYEKIEDDTIASFDPERGLNGWSIKHGWIAEVRMHLVKK